MAESSVHILKISPFLVSREAACNHHNHQLLINDSRFVYVALLLTGSLWKASLWKPLLLVKVRTQVAKKIRILLGKILALPARVGVCDLTSVGSERCSPDWIEGLRVL